MNKKISIVLLPLVLTGCVSMLSHNRYSDDVVDYQARSMAMAVDCVENGLASGSIVYALGNALTNMYSVSVYNKDLYEKKYAEYKNILSNTPTYNYSNACSEISSKAPPLIRELSNNYIRIVQARQRDLMAISQSTSSLSNNVPNYSQSYTPMPEPSVDFALPKEKPSHYLVDFGNGQRRCTATPSGYVFCS